MIQKHIFREYDIRGIYEKDLTLETAYKIGQAFGTIISKENKKGIVIGFDNRKSSPPLYTELKNGILSTGINVINIGMVTTPMYYFALNKFDTKAGIMITGSHNPKEYNGFKVSLNGNFNAHGKDITKIYETILKNEFSLGQGTEIKDNIENEYVNYITSNLKINKNLKVLLDCGNGAASLIIKDILKELKINYETLYCTPDYNYPNHHPDPSVYENLKDLQANVVKGGYDLGLAFDGDADRIGLVDEKGNIIPTDHFMIIVIRNIINKLNDKRILFDVKCSNSLKNEIIKLGGTPIEYRTGNSYLRAKTFEDDIKFSGEYSGHIFFNDKFYGFDDGIYAGLRMIEIMSLTNKKASELTKGIEKFYSTEEIKYPIPEENKDDLINKIINYAKEKKYELNLIDGCKIVGKDYFALIRPSNTGPNLTLRFEAKTKEKLKSLENEFLTKIKEETS